MTLTYLGRGIVGAGAGHIKLRVLGLDLGAHAEGWFLLLVGEGGVVIAGANHFQVAVLARLMTCNVEQINPG